jgi:hypothetical protein
MGLCEIARQERFALQALSGPDWGLKQTRSCAVEEERAMAVDAWRNRWYIAIHSGEPVAKAECAGRSAVAETQPVPLPKIVRKRKQA